MNTRRRDAGPYRSHAAPAPRAREVAASLARDGLVVVGVVLAAASIPYWSVAVDLLATRVLGFPALH